MKQRIFLLAMLAMAINLSSFGDEVEIDGLWYEIVSNEAKVIRYKDTKYAGNIEIPATVSYIFEISVTSIEARAFDGCSDLTSVTIPNSVKSIGDRAFGGCSNLASVTIGSGVTSIGERAFFNCSSLTSVTIPGSVTSIGEYAFQNCRGLTSMTIPGSVTSIEKYTFQSCTGLTSVTIPGSVTSIGASAFQDCTKLSFIAIPNSVTAIGGSAFYGCTNLIYAAIPNSVTEIEGYTFYNCSSLTAVNIPNSVTSIKVRAFSGCSSLTSITIPNNVTSLEGAPFSGCTSLTSIIVESGNTEYDSRENCNAIIKTSTNELILGCKNTIIPSSVASIGNSAFFGCSGLTSVTIPNNVTSVGKHAFYQCRDLTSVTFGKSMGSIAEMAFAQCKQLTDVYCYAENVPSTGSNLFYGSSISSSTLHIPASALDSYSTADPWSGFGTIVALPEQCATPVIDIVDGKLQFTCETEDVKFMSSMTFQSANKELEDSEAVIAGTVVCRISVYATKDGLEDSDVVTKDVTVNVGMKGDVNGDGAVSPADAIEALYIFFGVGQDNASVKVQPTLEPQ